MEEVEENMDHGIESQESDEADDESNESSLLSDEEDEELLLIQSLKHAVRMEIEKESLKLFESINP